MKEGLTSFLVVFLPILLLFGIFLFLASKVEVPPPPTYDVVCWDSMGNNILITRADPGTLEVREGVWYFKNSGSKRIVMGDCLAVEIN